MKICSFRFASILVFLSAFVAFAGPAQAELAVASGGRVRLTAMGSFDPLCHSLGYMTVSVIQQPYAGTILVNNVRDFPNFSVFNTRSRCNLMRLPLTQVTYQANPGYVGSDETTVELVGPLGRIFRLHYIISVRPGLAQQPVDVPTADYTRRPWHSHYAQHYSAHHYAAKAHVSVVATRSSHTPPESLHKRKKPAQNEPPIGI